MASNIYQYCYSGSAHGDGMGRNSGDIAYSGMNTSSLNRTTSAPKSGDIAYLGMNTLSLNRTTSLQSPPGTPNKFLNETTSRRKRGSEDSPPELRGYAFDRHNSNLSTTDEDGNRDGGDEWEVLACDIRVEKKVGEGAFGEIRKATWKGCEVAVKTLKADCQNDVIALKDFNREMSIWSRLVHPNVVQFLGVGYKRNVPRIMICEFMEGGSLQQKLMSMHHSGKKMLLDQGFGLLKGIASAMTYMHSRRPFAVIHRDLKPANILLTAAGEAKLADFGLSKMLDIETPRAPRLSTASASPSSYNSTEDLDVDVTDVIGGAFPETSKNVLPSPSVFGKAFSFLTPINNETGVKPTEAELVEADQLESRRNNYGEKLYSTLYDHSILMTGETGAYKYMAPEVFKNEAYGLKCDVYSFGVIAYEIFEGLMLLQDPLSWARTAAGTDQVRPAWMFLPAYDTRRTAETTEMIEQCWHDDPNKRPTFMKIGSELRRIGRILRAERPTPQCGCVVM